MASVDAYAQSIVDHVRQRFDDYACYALATLAKIYEFVHAFVSENKHLSYYSAPVIAMC
jgi:hypothetical protein